MSDHFRGAFAEHQLGIRTGRLPAEVLDRLESTLKPAAKDGLLALLLSIGKKSGKGTDSGDDDVAATPDDTAADPKTAHLLFLSRQEIDAVASFAAAEETALADVFSKKKVEPKKVEKLRKQLREHLEAATSSNAVDVGLFGRFVTSDEFDTIDAALQVAHALGTQKVEVEYDYFTAVDDLGEDPGAGHLGETEFASSVMYLYAVCDLRQLEANLGARTEAGRTPDAESRALARRSLPALVRAMAEATPTGKRTGTAPHTPAEYIEVVVRRGGPISYANSFITPVSARGGDVMTTSIAQLLAHRNKLESVYCRGEDVLGRFVLSLHDLDKKVVNGTSVANVQELTKHLSNALDLSAREG